MKVKNYREVKAEPIAGETGVAFRPLSKELEETADCGFCLYEVEPGASTTPHAAYRKQQVFVLTGMGSVVREEGESPLSVGDVVCVSPAEHHHFVNRGEETLRLQVVLQLPRWETLAGAV